MESIDTIAEPNANAASPASSPARRTDPVPAEEPLMLLAEAAGALIRPADGASVISEIFRLAMRVIAADAYALWIFDPASQQWDVASSDGLSVDYLENATVAVSATTPVMHDTLSVPDVFDEPLLSERWEGYRGEGIASILVVALRIAGENHGTLTFYFRTPHAPPDREIRIAEALANMASAAVESSRLRAQQHAASALQEETNRRLAILVEASAILSTPLELYGAEPRGAPASAVPERSPLAQLADLLVPALGDICVLDLFTADDAPARIELATSDGVRRDLLARVQLRGWRAAPDTTETVSERLARGAGVLGSDVDDAWLSLCAPSVEQRAFAHDLGSRSLMMVPLMARGAVLGAFTLVSLGRHAYDAGDLAWLESLARRTAVAIDNERLFHDAQVTAERLREANAAKDEFLGLVSHELRTPLTVIRGNAGAIVRHRGRIPPEQLNESLQDIINESERLNRIVENLLLLARVEQGRAPEREPVLIVRVVERVIARRRRLSPGRRFRIVENSQPRPVSFPEGYLEQVLENLVSNAEKYSPPDKLIVVEVTRSSETVTVEVRDRGPGIRDDDAEHLFDAFYRSEHTSDDAAGLGIGLAVCRRLVEAFGGRIWGRSRPGGGSIFGFSLPILADDD